MAHFEKSAKPTHLLFRSRALRPHRILVHVHQKKTHASKQPPHTNLKGGDWGGLGNKALKKGPMDQILIDLQRFQTLPWTKSLEWCTVFFVECKLAGGFLPPS